MNLMPEVGFLEIVVVAIIALVVVGPKDLPRLMRMAGKAAAQARRMAGEFTAAFNQMARESEMEDMRREIEALKRDNPVAEAKRTLDDAVRPVAAAVRDEAADLRKVQTPQLPAEPGRVE
jgi:sec-independent protein translocase protein TatB